MKSVSLIPTDLPSILEIYQRARQFMADTGNKTQWGNTYPPVSLVTSDLEKNQLYVITTDHIIHGVFVFMAKPEPNYETIEAGAWLSNTPYRAIHRVASDGTQRGIIHLDNGSPRIAYEFVALR